MTDPLPTDPQPFFIVGAPRSGTTLLAALLGAHSRISCGPETHFFRRLAQADLAALCRPETWPDAAVDFIASLQHTDYVRGGQAGARPADTAHVTLLEKYGLDRQAIHDDLAGREPALAAMLSSVTRPYMAAAGKQRWAEKTPDHLLHTGLIRRVFPQAPLVRILRDPRDVALSLLRLPWGVKSFVEGLEYWKKLDDASAAFFAADPCTYTLRYEDLVHLPQVELEKLCAFLGETFEPGMLDTSRTGKQVNRMNAPWKDKASQPVDPSRASAWRRELSEADQRLAWAWLGDRLAAWDYPLDGAPAGPSRLGVFFPPAAAVKYAAQSVDQLASLAAGGLRFWPASPAEHPQAAVFLGDPARENWLGDGGKLRQLRTTLGLILGAWLRRLRGQPVAWLPGGESPSRGSLLERSLRLLFAPYRLGV